MGVHSCARMLTDRPLFLLLPSLTHSLLGEGPLERPGARLCLPAGPLRIAAKGRYGKRLELESTAHVLIAGNYGSNKPGALSVGPWPQS